MGPILLVGDADALAGVYLNEASWQPLLRPEWRRDDDARLAEAERQVLEYFAGTRRAFELPLSMGGTDFQRRVWQALGAIPYGETTSYGALARSLGTPGASRAVGAANGQNPLSIIVPCHRVIAQNGKLTGYGGGLERKEWLLAHEARQAGVGGGRLL